MASSRASSALNSIENRSKYKRRNSSTSLAFGIGMWRLGFGAGMNPQNQIAELRALFVVFLSSG